LGQKFPLRKNIGNIFWQKKSNGKYFIEIFHLANLREKYLSKKAKLKIQSSKLKVGNSQPAQVENSQPQVENSQPSPFTLKCKG